MTITPEELVNELKRLWELLPEDLDQVAGGTYDDVPNIETVGMYPDRDKNPYQTDGDYPSCSNTNGD